VKTLLLALGVMALVTLPLSAIAWDDNFDSYSPGGLVGQSTWEGWDLNPAFDANVTNALARSAPNSVEILTTSDVTNDMGGLQSGGLWLMTAWSFVPGNATGEQYFIMLNQYNPTGTPDNWSIQVKLDATNNVILDDIVGGATLPLIRDTWIKVEVAIDLDGNIQTFFYNDQVLYSDSWTEHVSGLGNPTIAVLDLFSNGGTPVFWDDLSLVDVTVTAVEPTSWGVIKNTFK
jgi:hypothetical protein